MAIVDVPAFAGEQWPSASGLGLEAGALQSSSPDMAGRHSPKAFDGGPLQHDASPTAAAAAELLKPSPAQHPCRRQPGSRPASPTPGPDLKPIVLLPCHSSRAPDSASEGSAASWTLSLPHLRTTAPSPIKTKNCRRTLFLYHQSMMLPTHSSSSLNIVLLKLKESSPASNSWILIIRCLLTINQAT